MKLELKRKLAKSDHGSLFQPIETGFHQTADKKKALSIQRFIELLEEEEAYYGDERFNTRLMITRLRKIFYDDKGYSKYLIPGAADIPGRYRHEFTDGPGSSASYGITLVKPGGLLSAHRPIDITVHHQLHRVYDDRAGTAAVDVPLVFDNDNQEVVLTDGLYCDIGHVFTGIDAFNHPSTVTPVSGFPRWVPACIDRALQGLFPSIRRNFDATTWLGDISSVAAEALFKSGKKGQELNVSEKQSIIDEYAPGQDMLGNIDAFAIARYYDIASQKGMRVTDILRDYYLNEGQGAGKSFMRRRYRCFCESVGLLWNGMAFSNQSRWLRDYVRQIRDGAVFYILSNCSGDERYIEAVAAWISLLDGYMEVERYTRLFLKTLSECLAKEIKNDPA